MVKAKQEVDFPRGPVPKTGSNSVKEAKKKKDKLPFLNDIFEEKNGKHEESSTDGKKGKKKKNKLTSDEMQLLAGGGGDHYPGELLTYENICEDVLALGRVSKVQDGRLSVDLPCRVVGSIELFDISRPYTKLMKGLAKGKSIEDVWYPVPEMFTVGELIAVKVKSIESSGKGKKIVLTANPSEIHKNYSYMNIMEGMILTAAVESVEDHGFIMDVGIENTRCFLPKDRVSKFVQSVNRGRPLGIGQIVSCQVMAAKQAGDLCNVTLSADPKSVHKFKYADEMCLNYSLLLPGMMMDALVTEIYKGGIKVHVMELEGYIHRDHLRDTWADPSSVELGTNVPARILYLFPNATTPYLSLQPKLYPHNVSPRDASAPLGTNMKATVVRMDKAGLVIRLPHNQKGIVSMRRCSDDPACNIEDIKAKFPKGSSHECKVLEFSMSDGVYICSFQKSMLEEKIIHFHQAEPGQVVQCTLIEWKPTNAVVRFGKVKGFISKLNFGNVPIKDAPSKFPPGSVFKAKILSTIPEKQVVLLTAKKDLVKSKVPVLTSYEDCKKALISKGIVRCSNSGGIIIDTIGGITVFAPKKYLGVEKEAAVDKLFFPGRIVSFQVVYASAEKKKCIVSLLIREPPASTEAETAKTEKKAKKRKQDKEALPDKTDSKKKRKANTEAVKNAEEMIIDATEEVKSEIKEEEVESSEVAEESVVNNEGLLLPSQSFWDVKDSGDEEELGFDAGDAALPKRGEESTHLTKKERRKLKEQKLREAESALADNELSLQSEDDFERLILASPNSSICWIKYMAFFLDKGEILKAREIGARALKTILYREEQERFNVWVALLNFENTHGTKESLESVLSDAIRANDEQKILSTAASIFIQSNKLEQAEEIFQKMVKKFRSEVNPYVKYGHYLYKQRKTEEARELLKKSLVNLDKRNHVLLISKFCQFELEFGERERGITMFDQLMGTYPKRIDLWLVYANALVKIGDTEGAKDVLIRAIECRFPPKKSKPFFTRLYEVDKMCSSSDPEAIRQLALEYTKSISASVA